MKIIPCVQRSPEWFAARRGIPTASNFHRIITPKKGELSKSAVDYMHELIAERFGCAVEEGYVSREMQAGIDREPEARRFFALEYGMDVREVGFVLSDTGLIGCSPDGLIGTSCGLEIKCPTPKVQIQYLLSHEIPDDHKAQVHGSMLVTGAEQWELFSYCPPLPAVRWTVRRNEYTQLLLNALGEFIDQLDRRCRIIAELV